MTNQDPIAGREAKIAAWQKAARLFPCDGDYLLTDAEIDEAVALMRSAPDGDAKLRELRDWVRSTERMRDYFDDGSSADPVPFIHQGELIHEIDRLLSKPSEPAPSTTKTFKVTQTGEHFCETQCEVRKDYRSGSAKLVTKVAAMEADLADIRAENARLQADLAAAKKQRDVAFDDITRVMWELEPAKLVHGTPVDIAVRQVVTDVAAARADQAAMARRELEAVQSWMFQFRPAGYPNIQAVASFCTDRLAALTAQQPEPEPKPDAAKKPPPMTDDEREAQRQSWAKGEMAISAAEKAEGRNTVMMKPDAATRDGDEVLRTFLADPTWLTGKPALEEWCRRELARGGK